MVSLQMVSIAITLIAGAILNAAAFTGGNMLAKSLSGEKESDEKRHNLETEKFNRDTEAFNEAKDAFEEWKFQRKLNEKNADIDLNDSDMALKFYNQMHPNKPKFNNIEPKFSNYYTTSPAQKNGELIYVSIGMLGAGYLASKLI